MIKAIFAIDINGGMGYKGTLPWPYCKEDLQWFKQHTLNQIVIMGRKTWDDPLLPKPLPNRKCYVATSKPLVNTDVVIINNPNLPDEIINVQKTNPTMDVFIIGGPRLILNCINIIEEIYLTTFRKSYNVDTSINTDFLKQFQLVSIDHKSNCSHSIHKRL